jgi:hypothetical protein
LDKGDYSREQDNTEPTQLIFAIGAMSSQKPLKEIEILRVEVLKLEKPKLEMSRNRGGYHFELWHIGDNLFNSLGYFSLRYYVGEDLVINKGFSKSF